MKVLYQKLAKYYDVFYKNKDYKKEVAFLINIFRKHRIRVRDILDVACGTGNHDIFLAKKYNVIGVDLSKDMLNIAKKKVRKGKFYQMDMRKLKLKKKFDAIICMFSAIAYNQSLSDLNKTLEKFYTYLKEKGIVVFDTQFVKETFISGKKDVRGIDTKKISLARFDVSKDLDKNATITFNYLVREGKKFEYWSDVHKLGLMKFNEYKNALKNAGFKVFVYNGYTFNKVKNVKKTREFVFVGIKE